MTDTEARVLLSTHNVGLAWFAGPGREGIDRSGRIPSFLLLRNFEGDERMRHYGLDEQINHLRESGITFSIMSEDDARTFLRENTYYYKLKSYRHNWLFAFKGVGGVGIRRSGGGSVGGSFGG